LPQPNLAQPQYGDVGKVDDFMKATHMQGGTHGPQIPNVGPGRPTGGGPAAPAAQTQAGPAPDMQPGYALHDAESQAKAELIIWQKRASVPNAGPATRTMLKVAQMEYEKAFRAAHTGTGFHDLTAGA